MEGIVEVVHRSASHTLRDLSGITNNHHNLRLGRGILNIGSAARLWVLTP